MAKVLVTGISGTGKSAALLALGERGHRVVDTDTDQWCRWVIASTTSPCCPLPPTYCWRGSRLVSAIRTAKTRPSETRSLQYLAEVEPLLRATATIEIDANAPLSEVVRRLEGLR